ncbi:putative reverse transcriptase domain-containing protein [Tanacetum coccineum]
MENGSLSQKGSGGGKGVKDKILKASNIEVVKDGVIPYVSVNSGNAVKEVVSPSMVDETVAKEKQSSLMYTTCLGSYPPLPTQGTTTASNTSGKSSYANVTSKPSGTKVNFRTLFKPEGNGIDVVVPAELGRDTFWENQTSIKEKQMKGFVRVAYRVVVNYVRNTWGKYGLVRSISSTGLFSFQFSFMDGLDAMPENVWIKLHGVRVTAFSEDGLSVISTKLGTPLMLDSYTSDMCMQSWGRLSYARAKIELRADVELKDNIVVVMPKITREGYYTCNIRVEYEWKPPSCSCCKVFGHVQEQCPKNIGTSVIMNLKKASQTPKGISVGQKMGFKPTKQVYQLVSKKPTTNTSKNKKNNVEPTKEVSKTNPFEVLASVENDVELDDEGKPLEKFGYSGDYDSEDKVTSVDNETASFLAKKDGYGTQSFLEQWNESYENDDYEYDPYDDDMYEGHEIPDKLQAICDNLDITVRVVERNSVLVLLFLL